MKNLKENEKKKKSSGLDALLEKINEIKPDIIKLWAKFDTLEDRIGFTDRKIEEKTKVIQSLVEHQKENSWAKIEDKIKTLQT